MVNQIQIIFKFVSIQLQLFKKNAIKHNNILIISKDDLILVKSMTVFDKTNKRIGKNRKKNLNDISLLVNSLYKENYNF